MGAALAPWLYQLGKWFAALAAERDFPLIFEALGNACGRSKLGRYFSRALLLSALFLLPVLIVRIRTLRQGKPLSLMNLQRLRWQQASVHLLGGCLIAGGILWGLVLVLKGMGAFTPAASLPSYASLLSKVVVTTLIAPLIEEFLFRGILLGLWLRVSRPLTACIGTSFVFAFLHFLAPPADTVGVSPSAPGAGFELLGAMVFHFTELQFFITDFATLFVVGMILAWSRVATGSLWLAIGLHAGWIFTFKSVLLYYQAVEGHWLRPWGVGDSVRSGGLPLICLCLTLVACHFMLRITSPSSRSSRRRS